ncbi:MAG: restriction endonuclease [Persephonella sp.]|nr:restriction endonuclease [Persephonella sp.]
MKSDFVDIALLLIIAGIVGLYVYIRYREEKRKKEENLIPNLEFYRDKFQREQREFSQKAERFKEKINKYEEQLKTIRNNIHQYRWNEDEKKILKALKGTEFEWTLSFLLRILGFNLYEPQIYKDGNIDFIMDAGEKHKICVDFVDRVAVKKLNEKYVDKLIKGKEKYSCSSIWIITNGIIDENIKKYLYTKDINSFEYRDIIRFFPSIRIVEDYYETQTKLHNYQLLYKETADEVIRRKTWIKEVEEKLEEARKKQMVKR